MSKNCGIYIFNDRNEKLVNIFCKDGGEFDAIGDKLKEFLNGYKISQSWTLPTIDKNAVKEAVGMGCLAAQVIAYIKDGVGGVYISTDEIGPEYNYYIRYNNGYVTLTGKNDDYIKEFKLYDKYMYSMVAEFKYESSSGIKDRRIGIIDMGPEYIRGLDLNEEEKFKSFNVDKIVGGKESVKIT